MNLVGRASWWKAADWTRAKLLRADGKTYQEIADELDMEYGRVAHKFHNEKHREVIEVGSAAGECHRSHTGPSPKQLIERAQRQAAPRSLTALLCGDPAPGQSALDKKRLGVTQ